MLSLVTFVWSIFNTVLRGYLVKTFWAWFVLTHFPTLPQINIWAAIGLCYMVGAITPINGLSVSEFSAYQKTSSEEKEHARFYLQIGLTIVFLCNLGLGWVVHHFMG